jgi:hypothetical protein
VKDSGADGLSFRDRLCCSAQMSLYVNGALGFNYLVDSTGAYGRSGERFPCDRCAGEKPAENSPSAEIP